MTFSLRAFRGMPPKPPGGALCPVELTIWSDRDARQELRLVSLKASAALQASEVAQKAAEQRAEQLQVQLAALKAREVVLRRFGGCLLVLLFCAYALITSPYMILLHLCFPVCSSHCTMENRIMNASDVGTALLAELKRRFAQIKLRELCLSLATVCAQVKFARQVGCGSIRFAFNCRSCFQRVVCASSDAFISYGVA